MGVVWVWNVVGIVQKMMREMKDGGKVLRRDSNKSV